MNDTRRFQPSARRDRPVSRHPLLVVVLRWNISTFFGGLRRCQLTDDTRIQFFFKKTQVPPVGLDGHNSEKNDFFKGKNSIFKFKKKSDVKLFVAAEG